MTCPAHPPEKTSCGLSEFLLGQQALAAEERRGPVPAGTRVELMGLSSNAELNGQIGVVKVLCLPFSIFPTQLPVGILRSMH